MQISWAMFITTFFTNVELMIWISNVTLRLTLMSTLKMIFARRYTATFRKMDFKVFCFLNVNFVVRMIVAVYRESRAKAVLLLNIL